MIKPVFAMMSAAAFLGSVFLPSASAVILLRDTFDVTPPPGSENVNVNLAGRQSGLLATQTYSEFGDGYRTQVGNSNGLGFSPLLLAGGNGGSNTGAISPNHNFTEGALLGGYHYIRMEVDPVNLAGAPANALQSSWVSVNFGKDSQTSFVNSAGGFGILFRGDGRYAAFNGTTLLNPLLTETYSTITNALVPIELRITDAVDGNAFNGSANPVTIQGFSSGAALPFFFTTVPGNFTNNFIRLEGEADDGTLTVHYVENLEIGVTPEPSRLVLAGLAALGLLTRRRRGK